MPKQQAIITLSIENGKLKIATDFEPGLPGEQEVPNLSQDQFQLASMALGIWESIAAGFAERAQ